MERSDVLNDLVNAYFINYILLKWLMHVWLIRSYVEIEWIRYMSTYEKFIDEGT